MHGPINIKFNSGILEGLMSL